MIMGLTGQIISYNSRHGKEENLDKKIVRRKYRRRAKR